MAAHTKHNATGRDSGKWTAREKKIWGPPRGEPFAWMTTAMLSHPAWRSLSLNARRIIDFLQIEHRAHAGLENGNLAAPYDQLQRVGVTRRLIRRALTELEAAGFLRVTHRGGMWQGGKSPSRYRLTFYRTHDRAPATNDWKRVTGEQVKAARKQIARDKLLARRHRQRGRTKIEQGATNVNLAGAPE